MKYEPCSLSDRKQRAIANMVNDDPTFIPEMKQPQKKITGNI
tara:strand:- start:60 stop:185 length:126 start_codon:yes stop_codon:yes gene_type:complete